MFSKIWLGLAGIFLLGLLWISAPHAVSAYYLNKGVQSLINKDDSQTAIHYLETALRFEPDNALAHRWIAKAYLQLDEPGNALEAGQRALQLSPNNPLVHLELGDIYDRLEDYEQASAHYEAGGVGDRELQLLVNYLKLADKLWLAEEQESAAVIWRDKVLGYGHADLYANWRLYEYYASSRDEKSEVYRQAVARFPEKSIILPSSDPRMAAYQTEAIINIVRNDLWPREVKLNVLAYYVWQSDSPSAESLWQGLTELVPEDANVWYYLAEFYRRQDEPHLAEKAYQKAIELAPDYSIAYLRLGMLSEAKLTHSEDQEALAQAIDWYQQYHQLAPDDPLGLKKLGDLCKLRDCDKNIWLIQLEDYLTSREPEFITKEELDNGWVFLGYDVDETRLVRGEPVALWLYWLAPNNLSSMPAIANAYQLGNRRVQVIIEAQNMVLNGGFEMSQGIPIGFSRDKYRPAPGTCQLVADIREKGKNSVVLLCSTVDESGQTNFTSEFFPVNQHKLYLGAGWIRGEVGTSYLGGRWRGETDPEVPHSYTIHSGSSSKTWVHYSGIVTPLPGANIVQVLLQSNSKTYFDNVIFVEVGKINMD